MDVFVGTTIASTIIVLDTIIVVAANVIVTGVAYDFVHVATTRFIATTTIDPTLTSFVTTNVSSLLMSSGKSDISDAKKREKKKEMSDRIERLSHVESSEESCEYVRVVSTPVVGDQVHSGINACGEESVDSIPFKPVDQDERDLLEVEN
ncbi:hypothetical protein L1987_16295 [Smallanthus sonchifolius]|uniref:Uncharacterized protein n=1 Tax=Smallanthus sonchifolius TaxID=185202 RepID=A0ACB9J7Y2_9ASTR|nr:hypothetical protein L1987_16295 [Smallanthus sonchifolius]